LECSYLLLNKTILCTQHEKLILIIEIAITKPRDFQFYLNTLNTLKLSTHIRVYDKGTYYIVFTNTISYYFVRIVHLEVGIIQAADAAIFFIVKVLNINKRVYNYLSRLA